MGGSFRVAVALALAALLALGVAACGGGDDDSTATTASTPTQTAPEGGEKPSGGNGGGSAEPEPSTDGGSSAPPAAAREKARNDSGGGADQFRVEDGDNSIQEFGGEADDSEREEAAAVLHAFLDAQAKRDLAAMCLYLSQSMQEQLQQLASRSEQLKDKDCAGVLDALTAPLPPALQAELTEADVGSLRTEGERAFIIYKGPRDTVYAIPMEDEDGTWKVDALAGVPLG